MNSWVDYYPFGQQQPGRMWHENSYRFKQGGQPDVEQSSPKIKEFPLRLYQASLGRWLSTDPYGEFYSPYLALANNPVTFNDPTGGYINEPNPQGVGGPMVGDITLNMGGVIDSEMDAYWAGFNLQSWMHGIIQMQRETMAQEAWDYANSLGLKLGNGGVAAGMRPMVLSASAYGADIAMDEYFGTDVYSGVNADGSARGINGDRNAAIGAWMGNYEGKVQRRLERFLRKVKKKLSPDVINMIAALGGGTSSPRSRNEQIMGFMRAFMTVMIADGQRDGEDRFQGELINKQKWDLLLELYDGDYTDIYGGSLDGGTGDIKNKFFKGKSLYLSDYIDAIHNELNEVIKMPIKGTRVDVQLLNPSVGTRKQTQRDHITGTDYLVPKIFEGEGNTGKHYYRNGPSIDLYGRGANGSFLIFIPKSPGKGAFMAQWYTRFSNSSFRYLKYKYLE